MHADVIIVAHSASGAGGGGMFKFIWGSHKQTVSQQHLKHFWVPQKVMVTIHIHMWVCV